MKKNINKTAIFIIAPPGSGKGAQATLLSKKQGFYHFMTSAVGKEYIEAHNDKETLKQAKLYRQGALFEPRWILKIVKIKTEEVLNDFPGIIYDGSPRTLFEAEGLYIFLENLIGSENIKIIEIKTNEQELKNRLAKRLICDKNFSHVFIDSEEFKENDMCRKQDGGILKKRDLDNPELFNTRISEYKNRTLPGLKFLKQKHFVIEINGEQSIEKVFEEILQKLNLF